MDSAGNAYGPYDIEVAGSEAEAFTEAGWARLNRRSGVYSGGALTFTGLTAHLAAIDMVVHGFYLQRTAEWTDASPATTGASPRRDMLVGRRQLTSGEGAGAEAGKTFLTVLRGTPAATPADPDHDPVNDEPLWSWQVPGGGGTVITGQRDLRRWIAPDGSNVSWLPGADLLRVGGVELTNAQLENQGFVPGDVVRDVGGFYSGADVATLTVPAGLGGLYLISVSSGIEGGPVAARFFLEVNINGTGRFRANGYGDDSANTTRQIRLAAGDTIGVAGFQSRGAGLDLTGLSLTVHRIGT